MDDPNQYNSGISSDSGAALMLGLITSLIFFGLPGTIVFVLGFGIIFGVVWIVDVIESCFKKRR